jgi:hypothetical protein
MAENHETLRKYFNADLFPGSLNVDIDSTTGSLHQQLDRGEPLPAFTIPRRELRRCPRIWGCSGLACFAFAARISTPHEGGIPTHRFSVPADEIVHHRDREGVRRATWRGSEPVFLTDIGKVA